MTPVDVAMAGLPATPVAAVSAPVALRGHLALRAEVRTGDVTVLTRQSFRAPFHVSKPYWDPTTRTLLVQVVNPTAGILEGDQLATEVRVGPQAALLLTTPSASRVFCMRRGRAVSEQRLAVETGGWLEVWPEALVPHRGSSFSQRTHLSLARGATAFVADVLMVGRSAHGEAWAWERLDLRLDVLVDGQLALRERFAQTGASLRSLAELAGAPSSVGFVNAVLIGGDAAISDQRWRARLEALQGEGVWIGVSPLRVPGAWSIKAVVADGIRLREMLRDVRRILSTVAPRLTMDARKL